MLNILENSNQNYFWKVGPVFKMEFLKLNWIVYCCFKKDISILKLAFKCHWILRIWVWKNLSYYLYDTSGIVSFDEFIFYAREQFLKIYNKEIYFYLFNIQFSIFFSNDLNKTSFHILYTKGLMYTFALLGNLVKCG